MSWLKKIGLWVLLILFLFLMIYFQQVIYGLRQLKGELKIIRGAVPITRYISDSTKPDSVKLKLKLVQEIKQFAIEDLGLKENDNYTTVFDQEGKDVLWVVTACEAYRLQPRVWNFPFLGEVSYKGYFNLDLSIEEAKKLDKLGYDVSVRPVTAWSTLGWFTDPILTNMLNRSEGDLAELIIHELTHGTLFIKDSVDFNENLASFIGEKGAEIFLKMKYGENSAELSDYKTELIDENRFSDYMLYSASQLDSLYSTFDNSSDSMMMANSKKEMIGRIVSNLDTVSFTHDEFRKIFEKRIPNNAYFMSFIRYKSKGDLFEKILRRDFDNDIKRFLEFYKSNYPSL